MTKKSSIPVYCSHEELVNVSDLITHEKSPYIHSQSQVDTLTRVINSNGWRNSIVVSSRDRKTIVKGRLLYETALSNGWTKVPVEYQEYKSIGEEIADMVADNRVSSMSEIDNFILGDVIERIDSLGGDTLSTGFDQSMIDAITGKLDEYISIGGEAEFDVEEEEASIKTLKLIFDDEYYKFFTEKLTEICEEQNKMPSRVIYNLAVAAYENEN